jgi:carboxyl-terminal processing protease
MRVRSFLPGRRAGVAALVGAAFFVGLSADHVARAARDDERWRALDVFAQVLAHVENQYVDAVPAKELVYGAIEGLLARLDPHTAFLRPEVHRAMREETAGEFEGLGLELAVKDGQLTVISPLADSPGARAGLQPGDRILEIDGATTRDVSALEATQRLKGPVGTTVRLRITRDGLATPLALALVRDRIRTESVEWRVVDRARGLVLVRVKTFTERTDRGVKRALDAARAELGGEIRGLVLDLRNNPGGLLDQAVRVADRFLDGGVIVTTQGRGRRAAEVERAHAPETEPRYPLAVLVNRGSASASEIVAGALQDHGRAVVVGSTTFGKGSVQQVIDLADGSGLKLTVARYYTPAQRSIQDRGIEPDLTVPERPPAGAAGERADDPAATEASVRGTADAPLEAAVAHLVARSGRGQPSRPAEVPSAAGGGKHE